MHTALKHLLMSTATVPLTEGHKMATRHFGFALSNHFGSLKLFYTAIFADTYSPSKVMLYDGELCGVGLERARSLGRRSVNIFENALKCRRCEICPASLPRTLQSRPDCLST